MPPEDSHQPRRRQRPHRPPPKLGQPRWGQRPKGERKSSPGKKRPGQERAIARVNTQAKTRTPHLRLLPAAESSPPERRSARNPAAERGQPLVYQPRGQLSAPPARAAQAQPFPRRSQPQLWRWLVRGGIGLVGVTVILGTGVDLLGGSQYVGLPPETNVADQVSDSLEAMTQLPLGEEMTPLQGEIEAIAQDAAPLDPSIFVLDLDTGAYLNYRGGNPVPAASTIKLPILVAFFQDMDAGKINPQEMLVMEPETIAGGSGNMQYSKPGTQYSAIETATRMITISDNTATNMLIKRLGGANLLNQRFGTWGLNATAIHERLPDLTGQNQTSAVDLAHLLVQVNQGELVSLPARDQMLAIMRQVKNRSLLPKGLDSKATIAHKTGNIKPMLADVGVVDTPTGQRYAIVVMVQRPDNDAAARGLIPDLSRQVYQYFQQPPPTPSPTPEAIADEPPPKVEASTDP
ncbi:MAG: serine hydrolase [Spirulinaceae cyanobacterium]